MLVNKKTTVIYMESYVQFQESVLNKPRVDSEINTTNSPKEVHKRRRNEFQHQ